MAVLGGHRHGSQVQAPTLEHGPGCEPVSTAQWVGQVLRATREVLAGTLRTPGSAVGTHSLPQRPLATRAPARCGPTPVPKNKGHADRDLLTVGCMGLARGSE